MHWARHLRARLRALRQRAARSERTAWRFCGLLLYEAERGADLPIHRRLRYLRRGFCSRAHTHYDLDEYALEDYLPDFTGSTGLLDIRRETVAATNHKAITDDLLRAVHPDVCPEIYGVLEAGTVVDAETGRRIGVSPHDWLADLLEEHHPLAIKPAVGSGGDGFRLVERQPRGPNGCLLENGRQRTSEAVVADFDPGREYLVTEVVQQADYASEVFDGATNTIRLLTLRDPDAGEAFLAGAVHRFGTANTAPVDTWDEGGLVASIADRSGTLGVAARRDGRELRWTAVHPDTGVRIEGTVVPRWREVCRTVTDLANRLRYRPLIAWDVVVTADGIRVVEANSNPAIDMLQIHEPLLADPRTRWFFEHHGVIK